MPPMSSRLRILAALALGLAASTAEPPRLISAEDLARHAAAISPAPPPGFTVLVESPFVVIGDGQPEEVRAQAVGTVRWATRLLRADYFANDPDAIYDIWLFKDKDSYGRQVRALFGEDPISPYGYCSSARHALIMNIGTGGGTLVHEMTHAFMHGNFPACPAWFNEGLASLYEQCSERGGHIRGNRNWRLPILQQALRDGKAPSFAALAAYDDHDFYNRDASTNYGVARYLCYRLQELGKLQAFYREFVAHQHDDPTGYHSLVTTLGAPDMAEFRASWEHFVFALSDATP